MQFPVLIHSPLSLLTRGNVYANSNSFVKGKMGAGWRLEGEEEGVLTLLLCSSSGIPNVLSVLPDICLKNINYVKLLSKVTTWWRNVEEEEHQFPSCCTQLTGIFICCPSRNYIFLWPKRLWWLWNNELRNNCKAIFNPAVITLDIGHVHWLP